MKISAASISLLMATCAVGATSFEGNWNGNLQCGVAPQNPTKLRAFSDPITMVVVGNSAKVTRNTDQVIENLAGKIASDGQTSLSGSGKFKSKESGWTTTIDGKFSPIRFAGIGAIYREDGNKVRDCSVEFEKLSAEAPKAAQPLGGNAPVAAAKAATTARPPTSLSSVGSSSTLAKETSATSIAGNVPRPSVAEAVQSQPVAIFIDAKSIIGRQAFVQEYYWKESKNEIFGKRSAEWTDQDFQLLEQKLREQITIERNEAVAYNRRVGLKTSPDENSIFQVSKKYLENAISAIPKLKYWAGLAREKDREEKAQRLAQEEQRLAAEAKRQQEADQRKTDAENEQQRQRDAQAQSAEARRHESYVLPPAETSSYKGPAATKNSTNNDRSPTSQSGDGILEYLKILLAIIAATIGGWYWNKFIRFRCPDCKSTSIDTINTTETDRWRGTKQVTEKHSRGTNTRHVQTTFVNRIYQYRCKTCLHEWTLEKKEEL